MTDNNGMKPEDVKANLEKVETIKQWILEKGIVSWMEANPETTQIDMFMAIHNVHKVIITSIAKQWEPGIPAYQTYRMADMTWRQAMRDLKLKS